VATVEDCAAQVFALGSERHFLYAGTGADEC